MKSCVSSVRASRVPVLLLAACAIPAAARGQDALHSFVGDAGDFAGRPSVIDDVDGDGAADVVVVANKDGKADWVVRASPAGRVLSCASIPVATST